MPTTVALASRLYFCSHSLPLPSRPILDLMPASTAVIKARSPLDRRTAAGKRRSFRNGTPLCGDNIFPTMHFICAASYQTQLSSSSAEKLLFPYLKISSLGSHDQVRRRAAHAGAAVLVMLKPTPLLLQDRGGSPRAVSILRPVMWHSKRHSR